VLKEVVSCLTSDTCPRHYWHAALATLGHLRQNILISVDTLRADHVGCYQAARKITPHIDSIARNGTLFSQVSALVPLTLPSHVTLFTSTYPFANGVEDNGVPFGAGTTLATILKNAGYRTADIRFTTSSAVSTANGFSLAIAPRAHGFVNP